MSYFSLIANRQDGFCQRLLLLMHVIILSKKANCSYKFCWIEKPIEHSHGKFHACLGPEDIFQSSYLSQHYISASEAAIYPKQNSFSSLKALDRFLLDNIDARCVNIQYYNDLGFSVDEWRNALDAIGFLPHIKEAIRNNENMDLNIKTAIHLRGGDLVYGGLKRYSLVHQNKIVPIPLAKTLAKKNELIGTIIFAQDEPVKEIFRNEMSIANIKDSSDFSKSLGAGVSHCKVSSLMSDVMLMSNCSVIYGGTSAVCQLAAKISNSEVSYIKNADARDVSEIILKDIGYLNKSYDKWQMESLTTSLFYYSQTEEIAKNIVFFEELMVYDKNNIQNHIILALAYAHKGGLEVKSEVYLKKSEEVLLRVFELDYNGDCLKFNKKNAAEFFRIISVILKVARKNPLLLDRLSFPNEVFLRAQKKYFLLNFLFSFMRKRQYLLEGKNPSDIPLCTDDIVSKQLVEFIAYVEQVAE